MLALLIDGDNASSKVLPFLMAEVAKYGNVAVRRVYGDWTSPHFTGWKKCLLDHALQPIQQFANTPGKNATDFAMIIDAMDLLHSGRFSGFCIVSSDGDFTRLATRIREQGLKVYGFGMESTPRSFVAACDKFVPLEKLQERATASPPPPIPPPVKGVVPPDLRDLLATSITASLRPDGWAELGQVATQLMNLSPNFKAKRYGFKTFTAFCEASGIAHLERIGKPKVAVVRLKKGKNPS